MCHIMLLAQNEYEEMWTAEFVNRTLFTWKQLFNNYCLDDPLNIIFLSRIQHIIS